MSDAEGLFVALERINERPGLWSRHTAAALWSSPDISEMLLRFHLDGDVDVASRRTASIEASVAWITSTFGVGRGSRVIDLGCGPGLYANRLARTGAGVVGIDVSPRSLEHARAAAAQDGLEVDYRLGDYLSLELDEGYDLALMIFCDYCVLAPQQRGRLLGRIARLLAPGGAFLFDVNSLAHFESWAEQVAYGPELMDGFWSPRPYFGFLNTFRYEAERVVLEKYTVVEPDGTAEYLNWFQHYDVAGLRAEVETAGLRVTEILGDVTGQPFDETAPEFAVVVRRA